MEKFLVAPWSQYVLGDFMSIPEEGILYCFGFAIFLTHDARTSNTDVAKNVDLKNCVQVCLAQPVCRHFIGIHGFMANLYVGIL